MSRRKSSTGSAIQTTLRRSVPSGKAPRGVRPFDRARRDPDTAPALSSFAVADVATGASGRSRRHAADPSNEPHTDDNGTQIAP